MNVQITVDLSDIVRVKGVEAAIAVVEVLKTIKAAKITKKVIGSKKPDSKSK